ncbi:MAG: 4-hydroxythreonine-4-phosphate dehydrogenase PdxA [Candidatus Protistobacter heckmanni]|nr:4-hydroxythreonine-4-phosphate dehydrogenase PdxA [Candidatus Protistobacter heckmanni]
MDKPIIGLMLGDVTGIGPEVAAKLLARKETHDQARVAVIGDRRLLELGMRDAGLTLPVRVHKSLADIDWGDASIHCIDLGNTDPAQYQRGALSPEAGRIAGETLQWMTERALAGELDGVCFAPLNKAALNKGGFKFNDEHALFAHWNQHAGYYGEVNVIPQFSTFRVTSHVALRTAVDMVVPERIVGAVSLAHATLKAFGFAAPRIGVAALNPHAGESGLFGDEEIRVIRPTLKQLADQGIATQGPLPSDTVFLKAVRGELDAVVIMYHDQGQIATKLLGFFEGVTITGGLKTTYTTPAHGTARPTTSSARARRTSARWPRPSSCA